MVDIANWTSNILKMEHIIPSNNFQLIVALSKLFILISNDDFATNLYIKKTNMNGRKK